MGQRQGGDAGQLGDAAGFGRGGVGGVVGPAAVGFHADGFVDEQGCALSQFGQGRMPAGVARKDYGLPAGFHPPGQRATDVAYGEAAGAHGRGQRDPLAGGRRPEPEHLPSVAPAGAVRIYRQPPAGVGEQDFNVGQGFRRGVELHGAFRRVAAAALHLNVRQALAVVGVAVGQEAVVKVRGRHPHPFRVAQDGVAGGGVQQDAFPVRAFQHDGGMIAQGAAAGPGAEVGDGEPGLGF